MELYQTALALAGTDRPFVMASVIAAQGSTPQKAGANAVFEPDGGMAGTLGGGCLEAESRRRALAALDTGEPEVFDLKLDDVKGWDDGLICGGSVRVLVNPKAAANAEAYRQALAAKEKQARGVLITIVEHADSKIGEAFWIPETSLEKELLLMGGDEPPRDRPSRRRRSVAQLSQQKKVKEIGQKQIVGGELSCGEKSTSS